MFISATIICLNEADKIGLCLQSLLPVADELVVVDSGSTDDTVAIAQSFGAKVTYHAFEGHIQQKNFASGLATHPWILSLDADEALSPELAAAILQIKKVKDQSFKAFSFNRLNNYCGQWIKHGGWYPDRKVRLFHRECGHWGGTNPHDKIILAPGTPQAHLPGDLLHYTYERPEDFDRQNERFAEAAARAMLQQGKKTFPAQPYLKAAVRWLKGYVLQAGFLDGAAGWHIARGNAWYTFEKYSRLAQYKKQDVR